MGDPPPRSLTPLFLYPLLFLAFASVSHAESDHYWLNKAAKIRANLNSFYKPNPEAVANAVNMAVHRALEGGNNTRRGLRNKLGGPCRATNPIDQCWRCHQDWIRDRKSLAKCALGFASTTTGGAAGDYYVVTDPSDNNVTDPKYGTLRWGVIQEKPLWIVFAHDMIIRLQQELIVGSNKTIDGRGANVHISDGAGLTLQYVDNVIIHGVYIHRVSAASGGVISDSPNHAGLRGKSEGDGISIVGSTRVWIDHVAMSRCQDGLIDVVEGSTGITISNNIFTTHNDVMMFGASDAFQGDEVMQVTVAFNHFGNYLERWIPRVRWGYVHLVNNDYNYWIGHAVAGSQHPTIISHGNRYDPVDVEKEVTARDFATPEEWGDWTWRSKGDLFVNGAIFVQSGNSSVDKLYSEPVSGNVTKKLTRFSGPLKCRADIPC